MRGDGADADRPNGKSDSTWLDGRPSDGAFELRESNHRIANSLNLVAAMLRMQSLRSRDASARDAIRAAELRVLSVAKFHAFLHQRGGGEAVDLVDYLRKVMFELGNSIGLRCHLDLATTEPIPIQAELAMQLTIVIAELALNAAKHGYADPDEAHVTVRLDHGPVGAVTIEVADGGTGLPEGFDADGDHGLGMQIVTTIVREHGGTLRWRSDGGARFTIEMPLD